MVDLSPSLPNLLAVFQSLPSPYLLLSREFIIEAASDSYLEVTLTTRSRLLGRLIFEAFPDNPDTPEAQGVTNLRGSLEQVLATGKPHEMARQHYDVPDPQKSGHFVERYWLPRNTPVLNEQGQVEYIIHAVVNVTAAVQAERLLRQSQAREEATRQEVENQRALLQNLFEQAPTAICLFEGPEQRITLANSLMCDLWGRLPEQVLGRPLLKALPELQGQHFEEQIATVFKTQVPYVGTEVLAKLFRQGRLEMGYFNFVYQPLFNEQGQVLGVLEVVVEVTDLVQSRHQVQELNEEYQTINEELLATNEELRQAQQALEHLNDQLENQVALRTKEAQKARAEAERQRQRLERLFMQAPAAICILGGPDLVYELVNPNYQQLFPGRNLLGYPILEVLPELADNKAYRTFQEVFYTGETHEEQELLIPLARPQDGVLENRYFNFIQQARYDRLGQVDGVVVFAFEVTTQVKARQMSEAITQQLQVLTDALPASIVYIDREKRYQFANRTARSWRQAQAESIIGRTMAEVVGEKTYRESAHYIEQVLAGTEVQFEKEIDYPTGRRYSHNHLVPDVQAGSVHGFYALMTDITPQKEAQNAVLESERQARALATDLKATNERLIRTNVDLDNFIYTASHDLKAPIINIEGLIEALVEQLSPLEDESPVLPRITTLILDSVQRFKRTLDHLTEITKLQKENQPTPSASDIATLLADIQADLIPLIQATQARLEVDVARCPTIHFAEKNLRSILYNLISNALKYHSPERPPLVQITCFPEGLNQVLCVQDNGLGIELRQQPKLFRMFKRLHTHVEGTGIGLYMVKKIIENAGGRIEVESQLGVGSAFKVYFPLLSE